MEVINMENLINEKLAREAKRANSFSDYKDGSTTNSYKIALKEFNEAVDRLKERSNLLEAEAEETLVRLLERYGFTRKNEGQMDIWEML